MIASLMRASGARDIAATVHEPPHPAADRLERAEAMVFVADKFSWGAALFGPIWLAAQRLWVPLVAYVAGIAVVGWLISALGYNEAAMTGLMLAVNVWLGFEAPELKRLALSAAGWTEAGSVSGRDVAECERRFFDGWFENGNVAVSGSAANTSPTPTLLPPSLSKTVTAAGHALSGLAARLFAGRS